MALVGSCLGQIEVRPGRLMWMATLITPTWWVNYRYVFLYSCICYSSCTIVLLYFCICTFSYRLCGAMLMWMGTLIAPSWWVNYIFALHSCPFAPTYSKPTSKPVENFLTLISMKGHFSSLGKYWSFFIALSLWFRCNWLVAVHVYTCTYSKTCPWLIRRIKRKLFGIYLIENQPSCWIISLTMLTRSIVVDVAAVNVK